MTQILLVDNGSLNPAATLKLRQLAKSLGQQSGRQVQAVSLRHADRINSDKLEGKSAQTLIPLLTQQLRAGHKQFILLPLFFAENAAITSFIPDQQKLLEAEFGEIELTIANVVYPLPEGNSRLVTMLFDFIHQLKCKKLSDQQSIVLVDHGSPSPKVTAVRQHIAAALQKQFDGVSIEQAVMERRDGAEYDFNGPLLENWLIEKAGQGETAAIVVMLFFLPGRHAGKAGDIETICHRVKQQYPAFSIYKTPLIAEHSQLVTILNSRLQSLLNKESC